MRPALLFPISMSWHFLFSYHPILCCQFCLTYLIPFPFYVIRRLLCPAWYRVCLLRVESYIFSNNSVILRLQSTCPSQSSGSPFRIHEYNFPFFAELVMHYFPLPFLFLVCCICRHETFQMELFCPECSWVEPQSL